MITIVSISPQSAWPQNGAFISLLNKEKWIWLFDAPALRWRIWAIWRKKRFLGDYRYKDMTWHALKWQDIAGQSWQSTQSLEAHIDSLNKSEEII